MVENRFSDAIHPVDRYVGARLRTLRRARGYSQKQVGDKVGISFQQVQKYERGSNRMGASRLYDLACCLDVAVTWFFEGLEQMDEIAFTNPDNNALEMAVSLERIPDKSVRHAIHTLIKAAAPD
jgi:transcriptional regulator with XRE-family HTH domain